MIPFNRILLAGGTVASAIGIGFVMQQSGPTEPGAAPMQTAMVQQSAASGAALTAATGSGTRAAMRPVIDAAAQEPMELKEVKLTAADTGALAAESDAPDDSVQLAALDEGADRVTAEQMQPMATCEATMLAAPTDAAMVDLAISSCLPNARVTLHHNGMMTSYVTDANGALDVTLPAMSEQAVFIAAFADGTGAVASTSVPDMDKFDRVAVQWKGEAGFQLHAREYDADYGDAGHIWAGATGDMSRAMSGAGGVLTRLGDFQLADSLRAEVYTFPTGSAARNGDIALSVEAELTDTNCGRQIEAQSLQLHDGGALSVQDLTLQVPDCDGQGGFLVLKNLLQDLKIARN